VSITTGQNVGKQSKKVGCTTTITMAEVIFLGGKKVYQGENRDAQASDHRTPRQSILPLSHQKFLVFLNYSHPI
jgi:hypothetical protein